MPLDTVRSLPLPPTLTGPQAPTLGPAHHCPLFTSVACAHFPTPCRRLRAVSHPYLGRFSLESRGSPPSLFEFQHKCHLEVCPDPPLHSPSVLVALVWLGNHVGICSPIICLPTRTSAPRDPGCVWLVHRVSVVQHPACRRCPRRGQLQEGAFVASPLARRPTASLCCCLCSACGVCLWRAHSLICQHKTNKHLCAAGSALAEVWKSPSANQPCLLSECVLRALHCYLPHRSLIRCKELF